MEDDDRNEQFDDEEDFTGSATSSGPRKKKKKKKSSKNLNANSGDESSSRRSTQAALNELEGDVLHKSRASRPTGAAATSPGAVASVSTAPRSAPGDVAGLTSLESDALAKARASRIRGPPAAGVGAVSTTGGRQYGKASGRTARDSAAARSTAQAAVTGAVATTGGSKYGKTPGRTSSTTSADQRASLTALEDDVVAKTRAARVGATSSRVDPAARKQARTSSEHSGTSATATTAPSLEPQALNSMRNLESEVMNKQMQDASAAAVKPAAAAVVTEAPRFGDEPEPSPVVAEAQPSPAVEGDGFGDALVYQQQEPRTTASTTPPPRPIVPVLPPPVEPPAPAPAPVPPPAPVQTEPAAPRQAAAVTEQAQEQQPQAPGESYPGVMFGSHDVEAENIEAFVADQVVDATGVAVVMSEEEEERMERKKYRRYMVYGLTCFTFVAAAIVIPIVILVPDSNKAEPVVPTTTPSEVPTDFPTFAPTTKGFDDFLELVLPLSGEAALSDKSSPQYQAALWAANEDELDLPLTDERLLQRYFLACFYFATSGDESWVLCNRLDPTCGGDPNIKAWLTGTESECEWLGIQCDTETETIVETIFFRRSAGAGLRGTLPFELTYLTQLSFLSVGNNQLEGTIPTFLGEMTQLTRLWLQGNAFTGTIPGEAFAKLSNLEYFNVGRNQLVGTIPPELGQIATLGNCELDRNQLTGKIPPFPHTIELDVFINQLTGQVPDGVWDNVDMVRFYANNNLLTGTISTNIGNMVKLKNLRLGNNDIGGGLPEELFTLPAVDELNLTNCILTGTIPENIALLNRTVEEIFLDGNKFRGPIPAGFDALAPNLKQLTLHENDLSGSISGALCANRGDSIFNISVLTADCSDEDEKVFCDCCTECF